MSKELADKLSAMDLQGVDVTDANNVAAMLGYGDDAGAPSAAGSGTQGETVDPANAPAAAPAASAAPAAPAATPAPAASAAPAPSPAPPDGSATPAAAASQPGDIAGVLTKDGKHVIPHRVLQEARYAASLNQQKAATLEAQNAALQKQLEDLQAGRSPAGGEGQFTAEQLAEIEADHPQLAPLLRTVEQLQKRAQASVTQPPPSPTPQQAAEQEVTQAEALDMALASRPLLSQYRATGGVVWGRAVEIDSALAEEAAFAQLAPAARFEEVERRLAAELGVALPAPSTPTPTAAPATPAAAPAQTPAPAPAAPAAPAQPTQLMPTLTDLGGGGVSVGDPLAGMTPGQMVDKAMSMDMESIRRMAGLSY